MATLIILILSQRGLLQLWHIYVIEMIQGIGNAFHSPVYAAVIQQLMPEKNYGKIGGLLGLLRSVPAIFSPILTGVLYPIIGLQRVLLFDAGTFILAAITILFVFIPEIDKSTTEASVEDHWTKALLLGFHFLLHHSGYKKYPGQGLPGCRQRNGLTHFMNNSNLPH